MQSRSSSGLVLVKFQNFTDEDMISKASRHKPCDSYEAKAIQLSTARWSLWDHVGPRHPRLAVTANDRTSRRAKSSLHEVGTSQ